MFKQADLVQEYLAAVWSEVLQCCQGFTEDLQKTALHSQQGLLLSFLSLPASCCLFRRGLRRPLRPGERTRWQRLTVFSLKKTENKHTFVIYLNKNTSWSSFLLHFLWQPSSFEKTNDTTVIIKSYKKKKSPCS